MGKRPDTIPHSGFDGLGAAIIGRAVKDYLRSAECVAKNPDADDEKVRMAAFQKWERKCFFLSGWFSGLCSLDGGEMLERLNKRIGG